MKFMIFEGIFSIVDYLEIISIFIRFIRKPIMFAQAYLISLLVKSGNGLKFSLLGKVVV